MGIGEIVRIWGAINFQSDLRFFNKMYDVGKEMESKYNHWWTNKLAIVLSNTETKESLSISSKRIGFEAFNPEDIVQTARRLSSDMDHVFDVVGAKQYRRMGFKVVIYHDVQMKFEELRDQLRPICLPQNPVFENVLHSSEVLDVALNMVYKWNKATVNLNIGPMEKSQGLNFLNNTGEIKRLYSEEQIDELENLPKKVPNVFLYFDIDVFNETIQKYQEWSNYVSEVAPYSLEVFNGIRKLVLELPS